MSSTSANRIQPQAVDTVLAKSLLGYHLMLQKDQVPQLRIQVVRPLLCLLEKVIFERSCN